MNRRSFLGVLSGAAAFALSPFKGKPAEELPEVSADGYASASHLATFDTAETAIPHWGSEEPIRVVYVTDAFGCPVKHGVVLEHDLGFDYTTEEGRQRLFQGLLDGSITGTPIENGRAYFGQENDGSPDVSVSLLDLKVLSLS